ncbi:MAG: amino acid adenylation domain-containing protein, partial [Cyanobacteria bacterium J06635_15]
MPLRAIFESPTIVQLGQTVSQLRTTNQASTRPPIRPRTDHGKLPLSWAQERLWFLNQLEGVGATYNIAGAVRITGDLDINALQQALSAIARRHEVLRTSFKTVDGAPLQVIHPEATLNINVVDLGQLDVAERETVLHEQVELEAITPFDLEISPLIRCGLFQLNDRESVLLVTMHHIISDGWSIGVFIQELSTLYQAFLAGEPSPLTTLPIQYADFALWQRQWLSGELLETQLNYWRQQLEDAPDLLKLPTDRPRPTAQTYRGTTQRFSLDAELTQKLQTLSRESGTTLFMIVLTAFATLLYRYSGQDDILIGSPIANRHRTEIEPLIGFFVNTLVLRTRFADNPSVKDLLVRVRETTLQAYEHQDTPFEQVVEALQPQRSLSHSPLFQVMFILQNAPMGEVDLPGVTLSQLEQESTIAKFDLTLAITESAQGLVGKWEYNIDLFDRATIDRMTAHFQNLLSAIVANPQQTVDELPLLSKAEQHQLLIEWNATQIDYSSEKCIHELFEEQAKRSPDAVAVVFDSEQLTYQQLNQKANQLAHHLQSLGVGPEVLVGICMERSLEMVVGLFGILKAGGAYVPFDPHYPQARLNYMLADSRVAVLLTQQSLLSALPDHQAQVVCLDTDWATIEQHDSENLEVGIAAENLAYVIYTSGSTGRPKGTMNAHQGIRNRLLWMQQAYPLTSRDRVLQKTPFSFDVSVWEFFWPLIVGARMVVAKPEGHKDSHYLVSLIAQQKVTTIHFVPSMLQVFLQAPDLENCGYLRRVFCSGEALPSELAQRFFTQLECELHNLYGPTEAAIDVTYWQCHPPGNSSTVPIGCPIANTQIYLLDACMQPVPIGVPGELYIGGVGVARGYLNRPDLTAERFVPNPFMAGGAQSATPNEPPILYKTGDLARYLPDGPLEFLGRIDHQVKVRGFRIELGEIEATLNTHPKVQQTVVIATEDVASHQRLVAYFVASDALLTTQQLRDFLHQKLPEYMVPAAFVALDALPLTPNGKVDRKALPEPDREIRREHEYTAPRTDVEQTLTDIWQELLLKEKISVHDNFFEIGGDSILSIRVISRAKNSGIQITPEQIFQNQTIAQLAQVANTTVRAECQQGIVTGIAPLTPIQHWFLVEDHQEPHYFNQSVLLHIPDDIKPGLLQKAVGELLSHHDALRLRFRVQGSEYDQINHGLDDDVPFSFIDLSTTPKLSEPQTFEQIATDFQTSLNLVTGPIIRVVMFKLGDASGARLLMTIHHLAVDGVSWRILLSDLEIIYRQLSAQQPVQLSAKTTAFIDWAKALKNHAQSEMLKQELDYWLNQPWSQITPLPLDRVHTQCENTVGSASSISATLNEEETRILLGEVNEAYSTQVNDILLSALVLSLEQWTGNPTVAINLEGHGREELFEYVDLSRTVGWFTSLFPVLLQRPSSISDLSSTIKSIKEQLRAIPNRGIGYGLLRYLCEDSTVNQKLQAIPTPEIIFNYLGQFDQEQSETSWRLVPESMGRNRSLTQHRNYLLDINALVVEGKFQVSWTYSRNIHDRTTVEKLAQSYLQAIRTLIEHCQLEDTFGYTPSDFPDAQLDQVDIDEILESLQ